MTDHDDPTFECEFPPRKEPRGTGQRAIAKRLENIDGLDRVDKATAMQAAALIREQAARIAELEKRQIKVRWQGSCLRHAFVGPLLVGTIYAMPKAIEYRASTVDGKNTSFHLSEPEARAAVEAAAIKMMGE